MIVFMFVCMAIIPPAGALAFWYLTIPDDTWPLVKWEQDHEIR